MRAGGSVYGRAQTGKGARRRLRAPLPVCARAHPYPSAHGHTFTRLRPRAPVCVRPYPSAPARTCLRASSPVCARPLASARALRQLGFRFDTSASLKLPTVKKKMVKKILHADVHLKRTDGQVCPSVRVLNRRPNLHVRLVRQPWRKPEQGEGSHPTGTGGNGAFLRACDPVDGTGQSPV